MSISLSYNGDLSRVQLELTGLSPDAARIERSMNGSLWEIVRGGTALPLVDGAAAIDDYEFYAGQTSYRVLDAEDLEGAPVESDDITVNLDQVWMKSITYPALNRIIDVGNWSEIGRNSRSGIHDVAGRSAPVAVHDIRSSRQFTLTVWTNDMRLNKAADPVADAAHLDLVLAAGGTFFIHVPAGWPVPGGYVSIGDTTEDRIVPHGELPRQFVLPCTVVAPPGPEVVGSTLVWGTVRNLYGSWAQLRAANPTWGDLLATVGSPDDLVVL